VKRLVAEVVHDPTTKGKIQSFLINDYLGKSEEKIVVDL